jgi:hypothetical protein
LPKIWVVKDHGKRPTANDRNLDTEAASFATFSIPKDSKHVISLFMPLILCLTVIASLGIGVLAAYLTVIGILHAFGRSRAEAAPNRPHLVLVPTQNPAGGD